MKYCLPKEETTNKQNTENMYRWTIISLHTININTQLTCMCTAYHSENSPKCMSTFPLSSLWVLGTADCARRFINRAALWRLLLRPPWQLISSGPSGGLLWGGRRGVCATGEESAGGGHVRRLQESRAPRRGGRGGPESACSGPPGLRRQRRRSHSHPIDEVQRTGTEVCYHLFDGDGALV